MTATKEQPTLSVSTGESDDSIVDRSSRTNEVSTTIGSWEKLRRHPLSSPTALLAVVWLALIVLCALAPQLIASGDPINGDVSDKLLPPGTEHWFGTDQLGRDMFTRTVHGTGLTIRAVLIAVGIGIVAGSIVGAAAGFLGSHIDSILMRVTDVLLAVPSLLLSLAIIVALGFGTVNVAIAVGAGSVATVARLMRAEVLKVKHLPYVEAARASGASTFRTLWRHVLPNSVGPVIVLGVLEFGTAILAISALSFLGYGAEPPAPEWGSLVAQGRDYLAAQGWISTIPGAVIALTVLSVNRLASVINSSGATR